MLHGKKGERFSLTKVTYRFILKNYVQSKALFVVFTIRPLRVLRDAKRKPSSSFCISRIAPSSSTAKSSESLSEESSSYSESWSSPGSLDVGTPSLLFSFENSGCSTLSTGANYSRSPRSTAVWYMFRGRVPALYLVVAYRTVHCRTYHVCLPSFSSDLFQLNSWQAGFVASSLGNLEGEFVSRVWDNTMLSVWSKKRTTASYFLLIPGL